MKKIDFHCHIYHPKEYEALQSWMTSRMLNPHFWMTAPSMSPSVLKSIMNETGFDYCVNLPVARIPKKASIDDSVKEKNDFAEEINRIPGLISLGALHPEQKNVEDQIKSLSDKGFRGVKLHPYFQRFDPAAGNMRKVWRALGKSGLFVLIDNYGMVGVPDEHKTTPEKTARILMDFPDLVLISPHLGGIGWFKDEEVMEFLVEKKFGNLYMDISNTFMHYKSTDEEDRDFLSNLQIQIDENQCGTDLHKEKKRLFGRRYSVPKKIMVEMIRKVGTDRILFGTDWPSYFLDQEERRIRDLGLTPEEEAKIFYGNAANLLNIR
ncbi:MAG: amidohydrolase family protein [bacterium]|nr:amidohydrolase family protein [bacterium]